MSMVNVAPSAQEVRLAGDKVADQLGDELSLLTRRPFTEASLSLAIKLGLPRWQATMLEEIAAPLSSGSDPARLQQAANYLERARLLWRTIPYVESVNYWLFRSTAPRAASLILPNLWRVYQKLGRSSEAAPLLAEASRSAGRLATAPRRRPSWRSAGSRATSSRTLLEHFSRSVGRTAQGRTGGNEGTERPAGHEHPARPG